MVAPLEAYLGLHLPPSNALRGEESSKEGGSAIMNAPDRRFDDTANKERSDDAVVWTSLGPLPQWVPGPATRWAPGTTRLVPHAT
jgi:hypothetical protein